MGGGFDTLVETGLMQRARQITEKMEQCLKQKELDREDGSLFWLGCLTGASTGVETPSSISG